MEYNELETAKKLVEVLGNERIQSLISHFEKMKNPDYLKDYLKKLSETEKINSFLNKFHEFLLLTEDYISTQLDSINEEYEIFTSTKEDSQRLTLRDIEYIGEKNKLQDDFPKILRTSLVISLCSYIEDIVKNKGIQSQNPNFIFKQIPKMSIFESSREILRDEMGVKNIENLNWDYFINLFKIRNDLVHYGGKVNKSKNVDLKTYKIFEDKNEYLVLSKESLESIFQEAKEFVRKFTDSVIRNS
ncbi:hypothetical protein H9650_00020 [Psychrobacillus sp. Sa2BUA9]|uniref:RiboL-PSP-HEPN domain-containing protein n=1 Tax=Psychrobacillus faecigallinarum TaxID=2762235 RepID=A0ABR8R3Y0_9BACI|nr:hypothetical protein [Psychrobacillus faecigallinarum]MBD7942496.1 hypothetical protein [Psychrobacillus faecigallinarum]